ncbi:cytochrome P450 [Ideonella livida]|uniref:Cytochrome P450 n=1 Tax=Ideonella livida TaxID=2707176 RepID=A0A7C9TIC7_9BURK|nr:cytochrome P450 [Ideonella livida]NDY91201.1 cytochrome P450 [Ideonella livida]
MSKFCPAYPRPARTTWARRWRQLVGHLTGQDNLLAQLTERAYQMQMGHSQVAGQGIFMVNDPEAVRQVLVSEHRQFPKHRFMDDLLRRLVGVSIFTSNGATWTRQRRMMEPAFELTRMEHAFGAMREAVEDACARLRALPPGTEVDIDHETTWVTADIILRALFSQPLSGDEARAIYDAFVTFQQEAPAATMPQYQHRWLPRWGGAARRADAAAQAIREALYRQVRPRHAAAVAGEPGPQQDILASLLQARDPDTGKPWSLDEVVDEVAVIFLAGHETSAGTLAWCLDLLARTPDIQRQAHDEARQVLGEGPASLERLRKVDLIRRIFRETLRLYPPLSFFVREATQACSLRQTPVRPGDSVVISPWLIHRHRRYWERPDEFDPDRYLDDAGRAASAQAFLPFSLGPRVCVGAGFALQEANLVLACLLREFEFRPIPGHQPQPVARLTLRSDLGIRLTVHPR